MWTSLVQIPGTAYGSLISDQDDPPNAEAGVSPNNLTSTGNMLACCADLEFLALYIELNYSFTMIYNSVAEMLVL